MKHKITVAICVVALILLGVVASETWHSQQVQDRVSAARAATKQRIHDQKQKNAVQLEKKRVNDECHQLQATYDAQPVAVHKATPRPICNLPEVQ